MVLNAIRQEPDGSIVVFDIFEPITAIHDYGSEATLESFAAMKSARIAEHNARMAEMATMQNHHTAIGSYVSEAQ